MSRLLLSRASLVWLLLVLASAVSWWLAHDAATADAGGRGEIALAILLIAFVKVRFVMREFMEVRHAPLALRWAVDAWVFGVFAALAGICLLA